MNRLQIVMQFSIFMNIINGMKCKKKFVSYTIYNNRCFTLDIIILCILMYPCMFKKIHKRSGDY